MIPGLARVSLDVRHPAMRRAVPASDDAYAAAHICGRRGIAFDREQLSISPPSRWIELCRQLSRAVQDAGYPVHRMTSGAGHDAMILPALPSGHAVSAKPGRISHHPDESVIAADVEAAMETGLRFIEALMIAVMRGGKCIGRHRGSKMP